jgi:hypothetical protein
VSNVIGGGGFKSSFKNRNVSVLADILSREVCKSFWCPLGNGLQFA